MSTVTPILEMNLTTDSNDTGSGPGTHSPDLSKEVTIFAYSLIFCTAVLGNSLVILTLIQNKRMRTVTNVFLLNLAVSDLLLAVFCMPFTLIPILVRNFVFGECICISIRYLQGVSVGVSCFTLVAISMERYFAICRPLRSRRWQTLSHTYKAIGGCWLVSFIVMIPIAVSTKHIALRPGMHMCREIWDVQALEMSYTVFLDVVLLLVPICLMSGACFQIIVTLMRGTRVAEPDAGLADGADTSAQQGRIRLSQSSARCCLITRHGHGSDVRHDSVQRRYYFFKRKRESDSHTGLCNGKEPSSTPRRRLEHARMIRQTNYHKSRMAKLRVMKMLSVVVLEFFVCWTPLFTVQTWKSFHRESMAEGVSDLVWSLFFLLSYCSSCCNPVTYCFMNKRFRESFGSKLEWLKCTRNGYLSRLLWSSSSSKPASPTSTERMWPWGDRLPSNRQTNAQGLRKPVWCNVIINASVQQVT